jgi:hypothetical protein
MNDAEAAEILWRQEYSRRVLGYNRNDYDCRACLKATGREAAATYLNWPVWRDCRTQWTYCHVHGPKLTLEEYTVVGYTGEIETESYAEQSFVEHVRIGVGLPLNVEVAENGVATAIREACARHAHEGDVTIVAVFVGLRTDVLAVFGPARVAKLVGGVVGDDDLLPDGYRVHHDINGWYVVEPDEDEPDDGYSLGFDGRPHYATMDEARKAAWDAAGGK